LLSDCGLCGQTHIVGHIEASIDLRTWVGLTNVTLTNASGIILDPNVGKFPCRFYRAVTP
jgi:hypothetical protein